MNFSLICTTIWNQRSKLIHKYLTYLFYNFWFSFHNLIQFRLITDRDYFSLIDKYETSKHKDYKLNCIKVLFNLAQSFNKAAIFS